MPSASPKSGSPRVGNRRGSDDVKEKPKAGTKGSSKAQAHVSGNSSTNSVEVPGPVSNDSSRSDSSNWTAAICATSPVEDYLTAGLLPDPAQGTDTALLVVKSTETIGSVVEQMCKHGLYACIVTFDDFRKDEFFDCMDFATYFTEVLSGGAGSGSEAMRSASKEDWPSTKEKIKKVAEEPVLKALKTPRGKESEYERFDSHKSLEELLTSLTSHARVPVYRDGKLWSIVTARNILEMCASATKETQDVLEHTCLSDAMSKAPSMLSKLRVEDGVTLIEALHTMTSNRVTVIPITSSGGSSGHIPPAEREDSEALVGQFDITFLRALFARRKAGDNDDDDGHPKGNHHRASSPKREEHWWWENSAVSVNLLLETPMDFIALSPKYKLEVHMPWAAAFSEESLARAISRAVKSKHQSVVVYRVADRDTGVKPLEGVASTCGMLRAMIKAGIFRSLEFNAGPKLQRRNTKHRVTLTADQAQGMLVHYSNANSVKHTKVKFDHQIEVDSLVIPTCPEHGIFFMRFIKDDHGHRTAHDFNALKDHQVSESMMAGCHARCLGCQGDVGTIELLKQRDPSTESKPAKVKTSSGLVGRFANMLPDKLTPGFIKNGKNNPNAGLVSVLKKSTGVPPAPVGQDAGAGAEKGLSSPRLPKHTSKDARAGSRKAVTAAAKEEKAEGGRSPSAPKREKDHEKSAPGEHKEAAKETSIPPAARSGLFGFGGCCACTMSSGKETLGTSSNVSHGNKRPRREAGSGDRTPES